eukprot:427473_1
MEHLDPPKTPVKSSNKHKKKKKKNNDDFIKEQSTKKKKKQPQPRTKKKNRKNKNKNHQKTPNHSERRQKKNKQNPNNNSKRNKKKFKKKRKKKHKHKPQYKLGTVMIVPKNKNTWGWVYSQKDNMMYKLRYFQKTAALQKDQKVLFTSNSHSVKNIQEIHIISLDNVTANYLNDKKDTISSKDRFVWNTTINCVENNSIEFKNFSRVEYNKGFKENFVKMIEKYLNGFINMNGGTIYIGITDKGIIKGIDFINNGEFDILQQLLPERLNKWKPDIFTRTIIKSLKFEMKEIIVTNYMEKCAYIIPNYKVIEASIKPVYDKNKQVICTASDGFVYCREGSSLAVYSDIAMTVNHRCGKRKVKYKGYLFWEPWNKNKTETVVSNAVDFTVFDEGDDVDLNGNINVNDNNTGSNATNSDMSSSDSTEDEDNSHSIIYMDSDNDSDSEDIDSDDDQIDENNMKYVREYKQDIDSDNENMK